MNRLIFQSAFLLVVFLCYTAVAAERSEINLSSTPMLDDDLNLNVELYVNNQSRFPINNVQIFYRELSENTFHTEYLRSQGLHYLASVNISKFKGICVYKSIFLV